MPKQENKKSEVDQGDIPIVGQIEESGVQGLGTIKVIEEAAAGDVMQMSVDERDMLFERLQLETPDIPKIYFDGFAELLSDAIKMELRVSKPELKELLLRKIIQLSVEIQTLQLGYSSGSQVYSGGKIYNDLVIPIIPPLYTPIPRRKEGGKESSKQNINFGRRKPDMMRKDTNQPRTDVPHSIKVRFDNVVSAITSTGVKYVAPSNEELTVVGILLRTPCSTKFKKSRFNVLSEGVNDMLPLGDYDHSKISSRCDDIILPPKYDIKLAGDTVSDEQKFMFTDLDDDKISSLLGAIFDYFQKIYIYHLTSARFVYDQIGAGLKGKNITSGLSKLIQEINKKGNYGSISLPVDNRLGVFPKPIQDLLHEIEKITKRSFSNITTSTLLRDIDASGFMQVFYKALTKGRDSPEVKSAMEANIQHRKRVEFQQQVKDKILSEMNLANAYRNIIAKKLGAQRAKQIDEQLRMKPALSAKSSSILQLLKPNEQKIVKDEYQRMEKYMEQYINNKCPHVKIYRQFRSSIADDKTRKYFHELKRFASNKGTSQEMIKCSNCGLDLLCPHLAELTELELSGKGYEEIKAKMNKYIDNSPVKENYYCKVCGEVISSIEAFGSFSQERDQSSIISDELKTLMWSEMIGVIKSMRFSALVNVAKLISAMRDACYPYIFEIEKQILKSKTNSAEEIKSKKRLYITIYAYAYAIQLITSNKERNGLQISFKDFKPTSQKSIIVELIKHAFHLIVNTKNIIIREIPGMTNDTIKNRLVEAYRSLSSKGPQVIQYSGEQEDMLVTLLLDPIFHYVYEINSMDEGRAKKSKYDIVDKIDSYMGGNISKLEKQDDIYQNIRVPSFKDWGLKYFDDIKQVQEGRSQMAGKSVYSQALPGYTAESFQLFYERMKKQLYKKYLYIQADVLVSKPKTGEDVIDAKFRDYVEAYDKKYLELRSKEKILFQYKLMEHMKNYYGIKANAIGTRLSSRRFVKRNTHLGRIYDEDGNPHKWNIFIIKSGDNISELTSKDVSKMVESGTPFNGQVTDRKCADCGQLFSKSDQLEESKIIDSLNNKNIINNFFRFYENRCPEGGLHEFPPKDPNVCSKCKINNKMSQDTTGKDAMQYYRNYRQIYKKEKEDFTAAEESNVLIEDTKSKPVASNLEDKYGKQYANWAFNFNSLLDLSNKLKINTNLLVCLGAVEKQEYQDIINGSYIPKEAENKYDTRSFVISTYIKNLIMEYNMMRFFNRLVKPSSEMTKLIDASGISRHRLPDISNKLPSISDSFSEKLEYFRSKKKPREIVSFCVQTFCEMCLQVYNGNGLDKNIEKETEKLRHEFVDYIVKKILRSEEMLTKPGQFNWAILYGDKEVKEKESYDTNYSQDLDEEVGDASEIYDDTADEEGAEGTSNEAFKGIGDLDVETDPAQDPNEDDENVNDWKVGEDLGLT